MSRIEDGVNSRARTVLLLAFGTSLAVHGVAYASLTSRTLEAPAPTEISTVSFEVKAPPTPEPQAPPKVPEAPAPRSVTPAPARALSTKAQPPISTAAPAAPLAASPALDLSGVTLTNDTGSGFAMPVGDGSALRGPIGPGGGRAASALPSPARPAHEPAGPALVAARDLSEHPRPPALEALLRANYPEEARQRGLRGSASVRARIDADGVIRAAHVVSESSAGFGSACQRTIVGSRWSAPRAQNGDAVATEIVYTCHFEVD
jgi:periplasmic protein TonB